MPDNSDLYNNIKGTIFLIIIVSLLALLWGYTIERITNADTIIKQANEQCQKIIKETCPQVTRQPHPYTLNLTQQLNNTTKVLITP